MANKKVTITINADISEAGLIVSVSAAQDTPPTIAEAVKILIVAIASVKHGTPEADLTPGAISDNP